MVGGTASTPWLRQPLVLGQIDDVAVLEDPEFVGPVRDRGDVAGREVTVTGVCYEQRGAVSGNHDSACLLLQHRQTPRALDMGERNLHGVEKVPAELQLIFDQVAQHLAVDRRREPMTRRRSARPAADRHSR